MTFESDVPYIESAAALDMSAFNEIILIRMIADGPDNTCRRSLWLCLGPELHGPFSAEVVINDYFFRSAVFVTFDKSEGLRGLRRALLAALTIKQVPSAYVSWFLPQDTGDADVFVSPGLAGVVITIGMMSVVMEGFSARGLLVCGRRRACEKTAEERIAKRITERRLLSIFDAPSLA